MDIRKAENEKWLDKIETARKKDSRIRLMKQKLCPEISKYGRLCLMEEQIEVKLAETETSSERCAVLKCQKVVSICSSDNKNHFFLSEKGQVNFVKKLTENLKALLRQLKNDKTVIRSSAEQDVLLLYHKIN